MPSNIYQFTKDKLRTHGVENTRSASLILQDQRLFLKFVRLERATRADDFEQVRAHVQEIGEYVTRIGERHLVLFAYMYLSLSDRSPQMTHAPERLDDGKVRWTRDYRRDVTVNERLMADWATLWLNQNAGPYFRALRARRQRY